MCRLLLLLRLSLRAVNTRCNMSQREREAGAIICLLRFERGAARAELLLWILSSGSSEREREEFRWVGSMSVYSSCRGRFGLYVGGTN